MSRNIKYPLGLISEQIMVEVHDPEAHLITAFKYGLPDDRTPLAVYRLDIGTAISNGDSSDYITYVGTDVKTGLRVTITLPISLDSGESPPDWDRRFAVIEAEVGNG